MLTKPINGWTEFQLEDTSIFWLSYLDDIGFEWIEQAIHGLETMSPFCVKGFLEPNRFLCTVSYWNCHIICENDERSPLDKEKVIYEISHTNMLQFCQYLYDDINNNLSEWVSFIDYRGIDAEVRYKNLVQKLQRLKELITERTELFDEHHCFL